jgi:hypothetical protein
MGSPGFERPDQQGAGKTPTVLALLAPMFHLVNAVYAALAIGLWAKARELRAVIAATA